MTNEQRKAIEDVEEFNKKFDCGKYKKSIDTVLSLIKENQKEIEGLKNINRNQSKDIKKAVDYTFELNKEIDKKDKQIDLIIDEFYKKAKISTKCYLQESIEECMKYKNCKECLKQYFAGLVEKE